jgi:hypothetical protein
MRLNLTLENCSTGLTGCFRLSGRQPENFQPQALERGGFRPESRHRNMILKIL